MAVLEAISLVVLEDWATSVEFTSLGTYDHLQLRVSIRSTTKTESDSIRLTLGGSTYDTSANYSRAYFRGLTLSNGMYTGHSKNLTDGRSPGAALTGHYVSGPEFGYGIYDILNYRSTTNNTVCKWSWETSGVGPEDQHGQNSAPALSLGSNLYNHSQAIQRIKLHLWNGPQWQRGSSFALYGGKDS